MSRRKTPSEGKGSTVGTPPLTGAPVGEHPEEAPLSDLQELKRTAGAIRHAAPNGVTGLDEVLGLSSHDAILGTGDGSALAIGFTSADTWHCAVGLELPVEGARLTALCGFTEDAQEARPDHPVTSEALYVGHAATAADAMQAYGEAIDARRDNSRDGEGFGQRGWFTWNRFFEQVDEALVMKQAGLLKELGAAEMDLVEIERRIATPLFSRSKRSRRCATGKTCAMVAGPCFTYPPECRSSEFESGSKREHRNGNA